MGNYYYLAASLPLLEFPKVPEGMSSLALRNMLHENISPGDRKKVSSLYLYVDLCNIKSLFGEEEIDTRGNLDEEQLEEALLHGMFFPEYVFDFLKTYENRKERLRNFPGLLARFFREESEKERGFLRSYFTFERELRLVLTGLRAKMADRDLLKELQWEDPTDSFVLQIASQKDSDRYDPPAEYEEVKEIMLRYRKDPLEQNKEISEYRFRKVGELTEADSFSVDFILGYAVRLMLCEYWQSLDEKRGKTVLSTFKKSES